MARLKIRDVVVLLPGILGSVLQRDGRDVWAPSASAALGGLWSLGGSVKNLALEGDDPLRDDLGDGVVADRLVSDVHLIPYVWKIDGYTTVTDALASYFDVTPGRNFFEFPYDWRRDNRVAARRLAVRARSWLDAWRASSGQGDAKLILLAHSMGGLVARYFLEVLGGWRNTRLLLTFGTPYRGSINALQTLVEGVRKGPLGVVDLSSFVRSLTSMYQLLPVYPCYDAGDGHLKRVAEVSGISHVDGPRAQEALAFHHEIRDAVAQNEKDATYLAQRYVVSPLVGIEQPTLQSAKGLAGRVEFLYTHEGTDRKGDGTVPRVSATPIERGIESAMYAGTRHASLQNAEAALVHLKGVVSSLDLDLGAFRAPVPTARRIGVALDDAYWSDEEVRFTVTVDADDQARLHALVEDCANGAVVARTTLVPARAGHTHGEVRALSPGVYRLRVGGDNAIEPATDIFTVFDRAMA